ncbi:substrate-binding domain-containing protein [Clostridium thermarum]|uniref:substrate-binding domain-containing protein n=1 Tax=Clostridium thermarum TaxID=1716543 RepID=UPI001124912F|nr:substrate-binding domain-containing protein [Clostridium thermarum]
MNIIRNSVGFLYKHAISILLVLILLASLTLYWLRTEDIKLPVSKPKYHFYFIAQNYVDPFWNEVIRGVEISAKDNDVVVEVYAPRFNDPMEEIKYLDIATISRVDGIITHVSNAIDFTETINKAYDRQIPVITFENDDSESKRNAFVGTNSFIIGREAAKLIVEATGGKANIAIISSNDLNQGSMEHNLKMNGFISALRDYPDMKIIKTYTSKMGILSAEEITQKIIDSEDNINAIFTVSSADTLGCAQFIVDRNMVGDIVLVGYGGSDEILRYIDKEIIFGTVASNPYKMGYESLKTMVDIKNGKSVPTFIDTEVKVISKENLDKFIRIDEEK